MRSDGGEEGGIWSSAWGAMDSWKSWAAAPGDSLQWPCPRHSVTGWNPGSGRASSGSGARRVDRHGVQTNPWIRMRDHFTAALHPAWRHRILAAGAQDNLSSWCTPRQFAGGRGSPLFVRASSSIASPSPSRLIFPLTLAPGSRYYHPAKRSLTHARPGKISMTRNQNFSEDGAQ